MVKGMVKCQLPRNEQGDEVSRTEETEILYTYWEQDERQDSITSPLAAILKTTWYFRGLREP